MVVRWEGCTSNAKLAMIESTGVRQRGPNALPVKTSLRVKNVTKSGDAWSNFGLALINAPCGIYL